MDTLLVFFFISLIGLAYMIGRKMAKREILSEEAIIDDTLIDMPYMDEIKYMTVKKMKEYGYVVLFSSIKLSMKSTKLVKRAGTEAAELLKRTINRGGDSSDPKEVSKFLQMVTEYKQKIKKIKRKIREEEGLN